MSRYPAVTVLLLCALLAGPGSAGSQHENEVSRGTAYPGAAWVFSLDQITVVYPGGESADAERARRSAERRAAYLEQVHGVRARVRSDRETTEQQRQGNLLLLGWDNALLQQTAEGRAFARDAHGFTFLGLRHDSPTDDLLFLTRSPFDTDSHVLFWSRIDEELDRFQVLPFVGSDWAVFAGYRILRQGMFRPRERWPPLRDLEAETDHRPQFAKLDAAWSVHNTEHFRIHYDPDQVDPSTLRKIAAVREAALLRAIGIFGGSKVRRIALFVYADVEHKTAMTGVGDPAHTLPTQRELHMTLPYAVSTSAHEELHLLARQAFGVTPNTTLYEGVALAEDEVYQGLPIDVHAALMIEQEAFPALAELLDEERARKLPDQARFPAAGMLWRWLRQTAPPARLPRVYGLQQGSLVELAEVLDRSPESLEAAFGEWLAKQARAREKHVLAVHAEAQAQEALLLGDFAAVAAALKRLLELRPDDPQTLFNLASAQMRTGDYADAERSLKRLLGLELAPERSRFVIFGHYQLGRVHDLQGRRDSALVEYRRVLELPDQHDAHLLAREAIAEPFTADQLQ